jgi:hypothetical protein
MPHNNDNNKNPMSRRRFLIRQKGYHNLNVISLDVLYPRSSHTRSPSFRRARGIEEPPSMPHCPTHHFGRPQQQNVVVSKSDLDIEEHNPANAAAASYYRGTCTNVVKNQNIPSLLIGETNGPRKLPVASSRNADDASIPGATWQRTPNLAYAYPRGVDTPPHLSPYRTTPSHPAKLKTAAVTGPSTSNRDLVIDPPVRRGFANSRRSGSVAESESLFCHSYSGSSLSSYETRWGRRSVRLEFQTPSMRSLNSWYSRYTYNHPQPDEYNENHRGIQSPRAGCHEADEFPDLHYQGCSMMEEPDFYCEEEETQDGPKEDYLAPPPLLEDSGSSSRGTGSSSSYSSGDDVGMVDIGDGTLLRLRGAEETWRAVANDFYAPGVCSCCQTTVFCIQDAGM